MKIFILWYLIMGMIRVYLDRDIIIKSVEDTGNDLNIGLVLPDKGIKFWYIATIIFGIVYGMLIWPYRLYGFITAYGGWLIRDMKINIEYYKGLKKYKKDFNLTWKQVIKDIKKVRKEEEK